MWIIIIFYVLTLIRWYLYMFISGHHEQAIVCVSRCHGSAEASAVYCQNYCADEHWSARRYCMQMSALLYSYQGVRLSDLREWITSSCMNDMAIFVPRKLDPGYNSVKKKYLTLPIIHVVGRWSIFLSWRVTYDSALNKNSYNILIMHI